MGKGDTSTATTRVHDKAVEHHCCGIFKPSQCVFMPRCTHNMMTNENKKENRRAAISAFGDMAATAFGES
jgi:hypothetical protein